MRARTISRLATGVTLALTLLLFTFASGSGSPPRPGSAVAQSAAAQPRTAPAGMAVTATLTVGGTTLWPITFRGQVNLNGDLMLNVGSMRRPNAVALRRVGDQGYIAIPPAIWQTSPLASVIRQPTPCPAAANGIARLVADPLGALGGTSALRPAGPDSLGGVPTQRYDGSVSVAVLADAVTTFSSVGGGCADTITRMALRSAANLMLLGPVRTSVWVGDADGLPYRIRFEALGADARRYDLDARLTPSAVPFPISTPAFSQYRPFDVPAALEITGR